MAYLRLTDNRGKKISHERAIYYLSILEGHTEPKDEKEAQIVEKIAKVYFSWRDASPDWIMANLKEIIPFVMAEWRVDGTGRPTRPDNDHAWEFAKRYQLWANQRPASLALWYINNFDAHRTRKALKEKGYE